MSSTAEAIPYLHTHSYYSLLEGLCSPGRLARRAAKTGTPALALTDSLNLSAAVEFTQACLRENIQPILGLQVNLANNLNDEGPLTLLCMDASGWANLCALVTTLLDEPDHDPSTPCTLDLLASHAQGLICLTGGRYGLVMQLAARARLAQASALLQSLGDIFSGRLYLELPPGTTAEQAWLANLAAVTGAPLAAAAEIFYEDPRQTELQATLAAIRCNTQVANLPAAGRRPGTHFPTQAETLAAFHAYPQAVSNARQIAGRCAFRLPLGQSHFPEIPLPEGKTSTQVLRQKAAAGARQKYGRLTAAVQSRLEQELSVIEGLHFEPVFLIMEEIIAYARQAGIPTSSRGSAASSLVAHCLGITSPDPLALDLYFERFLNPARANPPDIDTDICSRRRDEILQHVFDHYGADRVAMVGTINRYRVRSALGDVAKAHGLTPGEIKALTARLPYRYWSPGGDDDDDLSQSAYQELSRQFPAPQYQAVFQQAAALLGNPRHLSVHPGGVVITPGPVTDLLPLQRSLKGLRITQFDHTVLEPLGVVKLDLLGIRGLTVLGDVAESIASWRRNEVHSPFDILDAVPPNDDATAATVRAGSTIGCFQIESPGMRATLKEIQADSIEDILAALALYRPGPLTGGLKDAFVRRHNGLEPVTHIHPALAPLVEDTYGVILYQEQVLRIANRLAGLSLADSDLLRRAMSHFNPGKQMETLKTRFLQGAAEKSGVDPESAERIWELMAAFAGYGFPKAHAASYAQIAWQSAWCKTHYPAEFLAAVLANWGGYYSQRVYLMEARRLGLSVRPPHVNHAHREFSVAYPGGQPVLYMGLDQVRDLTWRTQERLLALRPFQSMEDLRLRANPRREELKNLIRCGALDGMGSIPDLLAGLDDARRPVGQLALFDTDLQPQRPDWSPLERMQAQIEVLGTSVELHPLDLVRPRVESTGACSTVDALTRTGQRVRVAGMRQASHRSRTAGGASMLFLSLEDFEGTLDVVIFPETYRRYRLALTENKPILIEGIMESGAGPNGVSLRAEKIALLA